jgi:hypothetical protein
MLVDLAANYFQAWLEDGEPSELYEEMSKMNDSYTLEQEKEKIDEVYGKLFEKRINELKSTLPSEMEVTVEDTNNTESEN